MYFPSKIEYDSPFKLGKLAGKQLKHFHKRGKHIRKRKITKRVAMYERAFFRRNVVTTPRPEFSMLPLKCFVVGLRLKGVGFSLNNYKKDISGDYFDKSIEVVTGGSTFNIVSRESIPMDSSYNFTTGKDPSKEVIVYGTKSRKVKDLSEYFYNLYPHNHNTRQGIMKTSIVELKMADFLNNKDVVFKDTYINDAISHASLEHIHETPLDTSQGKFQNPFPSRPNEGLEMPWGIGHGKDADDSNLRKTLWWVDVLGEEEKYEDRTIAENIENNNQSKYDHSTSSAYNDLRSNQDGPTSSLLKKILSPGDFLSYVEQKTNEDLFVDHRTPNKVSKPSWSPSSPSANINSPIDQLEFSKDAMMAKEGVYNDTNRIHRNKKNTLAKNRAYKQFRKKF
jgi:hypothetical protein